MRNKKSTKQWTFFITLSFDNSDFFPKLFSN